jgi:hypothetical protein
MAARTACGAKSMFGPKKNITITIKLFGGLDRDAGLEGYDPDSGINVCVPDRIKLGRVIKKIGLPRTGAMAFFVNGDPVGAREKLNHGDIVFCMRPLAGG